MIPLERGGLNPISFGQKEPLAVSHFGMFRLSRYSRECLPLILKFSTIKHLKVKVNRMLKCKL
jgi:hypothetical protein